jgi:hypothetical protein
VRCGKPVPAWLETCQECGTPMAISVGDSDPTWPEPVSQPALGGAKRENVVRADAFRRVARGIELTVSRLGTTLSVTLELPVDRAAQGDLPIELGLLLVEPTSRSSGSPDAVVRLERFAEKVMCSIPARGLQPGDPAILSLSAAENKAEIQTLVREAAG